MQQKLTACLFISCFAMLSSFGQPSSAIPVMFSSGGDANPIQTLTNTAALSIEMEMVSASILERRPTKFVLEMTKQGRPIEAFYFPGKSDKRALIIGGMHGSELSSITIARNVIAQLQKDTSNYYSVLVLPSLFPDNAAAALRNPAQIGAADNIGRYSNEHKPDPNRQMPPLGKAFSLEKPLDYAGRTIEKENQLLLQLIQAFKPDRILNIHAIKDVKKAGVFADPRTDAFGRSLGFDTDSSLAVAMAISIEGQGGCALGNQLAHKPTAMYHSDFRAVPAGSFQRRNLTGSQLPNKRGFGVSLGSWATTAVSDAEESRNAIRLVTMEFPGCKRPEDYKSTQLQVWCQEEIERYTASITNIFLKNIFEE